MTDVDRLEERLSAVERTVVDGDHDFGELSRLSAVTETVERMDHRLTEFETRLAELEGRTEAVGGFVNTISAANDDVEQQANAAMAAVDRLEERLSDLEGRVAADDAPAETTGEPATADRATSTAEADDGSPPPESAVAELVGEEPVPGVSSGEFDSPPDAAETNTPTAFDAATGSTPEPETTPSPAVDAETTGNGSDERATGPATSGSGPASSGEPRPGRSASSGTASDGGADQATIEQSVRGEPTRPDDEPKPTADEGTDPDAASTGWLHSLRSLLP